MLETLSQHMIDEVIPPTDFFTGPIAGELRELAIKAKKAKARGKSDFHFEGKERLDALLSLRKALKSSPSGLSNAECQSLLAVPTKKSRDSEQVLTDLQKAKDYVDSYEDKVKLVLVDVETGPDGKTYVFDDENEKHQLYKELYITVLSLKQGYQLKIEEQLDSYSPEKFDDGESSGYGSEPPDEDEFELDELDEFDDLLDELTEDIDTKAMDIGSQLIQLRDGAKESWGDITALEAQAKLLRSIDVTDDFDYMPEEEDTKDEELSPRFKQWFQGTVTATRQSKITQRSSMKEDLERAMIESIDEMQVAEEDTFGSILAGLKQHLVLLRDNIGAQLDLYDREQEEYQPLQAYSDKLTTQIDALGTITYHSANKDHALSTLKACLKQSTSKQQKKPSFRDIVLMVGKKAKAQDVEKALESIKRQATSDEQSPAPDISRSNAIRMCINVRHEIELMGIKPLRQVVESMARGQADLEVVDRVQEIIQQGTEITLEDGSQVKISSIDSIQQSATNTKRLALKTVEAGISIGLAMSGLAPLSTLIDQYILGFAKDKFTDITAKIPTLHVMSEGRDKAVTSAIMIGIKGHDPFEISKAVGTEKTAADPSLIPLIFSASLSSYLASCKLGAEKVSFEECVKAKCEEYKTTDHKEFQQKYQERRSAVMHLIASRTAKLYAKVEHEVTSRDRTSQLTKVLDESSLQKELDQLPQINFEAIHFIDAADEEMSKVLAQFENKMEALCSEENKQTLEKYYKAYQSAVRDKGHGKEALSQIPDEYRALFGDEEAKLRIESYVQMIATMSSNEILKGLSIPALTDRGAADPHVVKEIRALTTYMKVSLEGLQSEFAENKAFTEDNTTAKRMHITNIISTLKAIRDLRMKIGAWSTENEIDYKEHISVLQTNMAGWKQEDRKKQNGLFMRFSVEHRCVKSGKLRSEFIENTLLKKLGKLLKSTNDEALKKEYELKAKEYQKAIASVGDDPRTKSILDKQFIVQMIGEDYQSGLLERYRKNSDEKVSSKIYDIDEAIEEFGSEEEKIAEEGAKEVKTLSARMKELDLSDPGNITHYERRVASENLVLEEATREAREMQRHEKQSFPLMRSFIPGKGNANYQELLANPHYSQLVRLYKAIHQATISSDQSVVFKLHHDFKAILTEAQSSIYEAGLLHELLAKVIQVQELHEGRESLSKEELKDCFSERSFKHVELWADQAEYQVLFKLCKLSEAAGSEMVTFDTITESLQRQITMLEDGNKQLANSRQLKGRSVTELKTEEIEEIIAEHMTNELGITPTVLDTNINEQESFNALFSSLFFSDDPKSTLKEIIRECEAYRIKPSIKKPNCYDALNSIMIATQSERLTDIRLSEIDEFKILRGVSLPSLRSSAALIENGEDFGRQISEGLTGEQFLDFLMQREQLLGFSGEQIEAEIQALEVLKLNAPPHEISIERIDEISSRSRSLIDQIDKTLKIIECDPNIKQVSHLLDRLKHIADTTQVIELIKSQYTEAEYTTAPVNGLHDYLETLRTEYEQQSLTEGLKYINKTATLISTEKPRSLHQCVETYRSHVQMTKPVNKTLEELIREKENLLYQAKVQKAHYHTLLHNVFGQTALFNRIRDLPEVRTCSELLDAFGRSASIKSVFHTIFNDIIHDLSAAKISSLPTKYSEITTKNLDTLISAVHQHYAENKSGNTSTQQKRGSNYKKALAITTILYLASENPSCVDHLEGKTKQTKSTSVLKTELKKAKEKATRLKTQEVGDDAQIKLDATVEVSTLDTCLDKTEQRVHSRTQQRIDDLDKAKLMVDNGRLKFVVRNLSDLFNYYLVAGKEVSQSCYRSVAYEGPHAKALQKFANGVTLEQIKELSQSDRLSGSRTEAKSLLSTLPSTYHNSFRHKQFLQEFKQTLILKMLIDAVKLHDPQTSSSDACLIKQHRTEQGLTRDYLFDLIEELSGTEKSPEMVLKQLNQQLTDGLQNSSISLVKASEEIAPHLRSTLNLMLGTQFSLERLLKDVDFPDRPEITTAIEECTIYQEELSETEVEKTVSSDHTEKTLLLVHEAHKAGFSKQDIRVALEASTVDRTVAAGAICHEFSEEFRMHRNHQSSQVPHERPKTSLSRKKSTSLDEVQTYIDKTRKMKQEYATGRAAANADQFSPKGTTAM